MELVEQPVELVEQQAKELVLDSGVVVNYQPTAPLVFVSVLGFVPPLLPFVEQTAS
jgi:hypothetical protein